MGTEHGDTTKNHTVNIVSIEFERIKLTKNEGWFKVGDKLVVLQIGKNNTTVTVVGDKVENVYTIPPEGLDCSKYTIPMDYVDICEPIAEILRNYNELVRQYEIEERARATRLLNYKTVPRLPNEFETVVGSLVELMMTRKVIKTFYISGNSIATLGIYCYDNGYYKECEDLLRSEIHDIVKESKLIDLRLLPAVKGAVIRNIADKTLTEFRPAQRCLLFRDKIFCWDKFVETGDIESALIDPNPDIVVTHRIPWRINTDLLKRRPGLLRFIPPETHEQIITLFSELAPKSYNAFYSWVAKHDEDAKDKVLKRIILLLEWIGYTLYVHEYPLHKALLLYGEGANGKSTYLRLIATILTRENIASVNLTQLDPSVNRFAAADLYGKLANISSEPIRGTFDPTLFKQLTGEDVVRIERKFKDAFTAKNYAKMIFAANELPRVTEDTHAFWRRWIVIEFPNRFELDPTFFERTFTTEEIEAIILLALYAFRLVLIRKSFTEDGADDAKIVWRELSNPVFKVMRRILNDGVVELKQDAYIVKTDLYELYKKYVEILNEEGETVVALAKKDFTTQIIRLFPIRSGYAKIGGKTKHVYWGIAIRDYEKVRQLIGQVETPQRLL